MSGSLFLKGFPEYMSKNNVSTNYQKKRRRFGMGVIIFAVILIYVIIRIINSAKGETIRGYQVKVGTLSENRLYKGIALRNEHCVYSTHSGYINFLIRETERAGYNNLVYCIDETGKISDLLSKDPTKDTLLTEDELSLLKQEIIQFSKNFEASSFSDAYVFENQIRTELMQIENRKIIEDINAINSMHINDIIDYCRAKNSGIVLFYKDNYEEFIASDLTLEDFDFDKYTVTTVNNDDLVNAGDFVYKYATGEDWSIVIKVPNNLVSRITAEEYIEVRFSKNGNSSWGLVKLVNTYEDYSLVELSFTNSMVTFSDERFVDVELILPEDSGLKVPLSSIVNKEFFLIDKDYVHLGNNSSNYCVLRREYGDQGEYVKEVTVSVYKETDEYFYVDKDSLVYGDILYRTNSAIGADDDARFIVGDAKVDSLTGVYCINKGYADFKRIEIIYTNEEYAIIENNSAYGLRAYDYIALDSSVVEDKDFVY